MAQIEFARDKLRRKLRFLLDEYEAMLILLAEMNEDAKSFLESRRESIESLTTDELRRAVKGTKERVDSLRDHAGATRPVGDYSKIVSSNGVAAGRVMLLPAYVAVMLFRKYPRVARGLANHTLAPHTFIELDQRGMYRAQSRLQFVILEATLFEDMCSYWNDACDIKIPERSPHAAKRDVKRLAALHRGVVSAAFYMVEAYCNGIAFEVFLSKGDSLSDKERDLITEWDSKGSRPRYATTRDKLLHYPRLLVGATAPLIQESNSPDLVYFLTAAKKFRDAIVHASPQLDSNAEMEKAQIYLRLDHEDCARIIDSAIGLIHSIAAAIERTECIFWLQRRNSGGRFTDSVFD